MTNINFSEIIRNKAKKNCYMEEIEYSIFLEAIAEKLENLKAFCNTGNIVIHELINMQSIIYSQLDRRKNNGM